MRPAQWNLSTVLTERYRCVEKFMEQHWTSGPHKVWGLTIADLIDVVSKNGYWCWMPVHTLVASFRNQFTVLCLKSAIGLGGQRESHLRNSSVAGLQQRSNWSNGRIVFRYGPSRFHLYRYPVHSKKQHTVYTAVFSGRRQHGKDPYSLLKDWTPPCIRSAAWNCSATLWCPSAVTQIH